MGPVAQCIRRDAFTSFPFESPFSMQLSSWPQNGYFVSRHLICFTPRRREGPKAFSESSFAFCKRDTLSRDSYKHSSLAEREAEIVSNFSWGSDQSPRSGLFQGLNASQVASGIFSRMAV